MIKASDILIARRADIKARADFPTWRMMAKLNATSSLSTDAQAFLADYERRLSQMTEAEATEETIRAIYRAYYAEMGGAGPAPDIKVVKRRSSSVAAEDPDLLIEADSTDNVIAFEQARRVRPKPAGPPSPDQKPRLPVALIFGGLVIITVGLRYLL